jgi:hypothetical protein
MNLWSFDIMGYYGEFPRPIPHLRVHSIVLLTLSPLALAGTFDLHVLAMPPAFNLSHDQTLQLISFTPGLPREDFKKSDHVTPDPVPFGPRPGAVFDEFGLRLAHRRRWLHRRLRWLILSCRASGMARQDAHENEHSGL